MHRRKGESGGVCRDDTTNVESTAVCDSASSSDMGQLHLCQLQLNYNFTNCKYNYKQLQLGQLQLELQNYQLLLQLQLLLVACKNRYRICYTIFCVIVHRH